MNAATSTVRPRISTLRWLVPLILASVAVFYQLGPAAMIAEALGETLHYYAEILFYGTTGPLVVFWMIGRIENWIAEKEKAEREARISESRLATITAASADAILSVDGQGRIESWNNGARMLFGYDEEQVIGEQLSSLFAAKEGAALEFQWLMESVTRGGYLRGHETTCRDSRGRELLVDLTATVMHDPQGAASGVSVILRDITSRRQREKEIERLNVMLNQQVSDRTAELAAKVSELARANEELYKLDRMRSEFVSIVSHQIRAPLANISGAADRMRAECALDTRICGKMLAVLDQQVARLDRLVVNLLNAARIEAEEIFVQAEPLSVLPLLAQARETVQTSLSGREVVLPTKPGMPMVFADRDLLIEVLVNLLDNADKYSPAGDPITVDVRADDLEVVVSIRDKGSGILPQDSERVFDKFYRGETGDAQATYGYGLGLFVCRSLLEAQGGRIWVENHPQGGAVFSIALPVKGIEYG